MLSFWGDMHEKYTYKKSIQGAQDKNDKTIILSDNSFVSSFITLDRIHLKLIFPQKVEA